jgi:hypothetical protein
LKKEYSFPCEELEIVFSATTAGSSLETDWGFCFLACATGALGKRHTHFQDVEYSLEDVIRASVDVADAGHSDGEGRGSIIWSDIVEFPHLSVDTLSVQLTVDEKKAEATTGPKVQYSTRMVGLQDDGSLVGEPTLAVLPASAMWVKSRRVRIQVIATAASTPKIPLPSTTVSEEPIADASPPSSDTRPELASSPEPAIGATPAHSVRTTDTSIEDVSAAQRQVLIVARLTAQSLSGKALFTALLRQCVREGRPTPRTVLQSMEQWTPTSDSSLLEIINVTTGCPHVQMCIIYSMCSRLQAWMSSSLETGRRNRYP